MKSSRAHESSFAASRSLGFVPLVLLACCATACGGGSKSNGGGSSPDATSGDDGGYGLSSSSGFTIGSSSGSSSSGASESGVDDSGADGSSEDGSSSSSGGGEGGEDGPSGSSDGSVDSGSADSGSSGGSDSGGTDSGSTSSSSSGGADSGIDSSSSSGGVDGGSDSSGSSSGGVDSGSSSSGGSDSGGMDAAAEAEASTTCNLSGAWALKVEVQVTWQGTAILAAGGGTVDLWALIQGTQSGNSVPTTVLPCGLALPDFNGPAIAGSPTFGVSFPNTLFDGTFLTATTSTLTLSSSAPGATLTSPAEASLIGIAFANPATAAWPNLATAQTDEVDTDVDTHVGVTAQSKAGERTENDSGTYATIPVGLLGPETDQLYMALRSVIALNGTLTSCTRASGPANVSHMDDHTLGCHLTTGGDCSSVGNASQAAFVDTNSPTFTVSSATFQAQMLTNTASCPNVRAALP